MGCTKEGDQGSLQTCRYNGKGDLIPASLTSSRQEGSVPYINKMEDESGNDNPKVAGGGISTIQKDKTMAQNLRHRQNKHQLEKKRC